MCVYIYIYIYKISNLLILLYKLIPKKNIAILADFQDRICCEVNYFVDSKPLYCYKFHSGTESVYSYVVIANGIKAALNGTRVNDNSHLYMTEWPP